MSNLKLPSLDLMALRELVPLGADRLIGYKTRVAHETQGVAIAHHSTVIATIAPFDIHLSTGGYNSTTTANRLNKVMQDNRTGFNVGIVQGQTVVKQWDASRSKFTILGRANGAHFAMQSGVWQHVA